MIPIRPLLSRIRWDREFGRGYFEIGYYDRVLDAIVRVPLTGIIFTPNGGHAIQIPDAEGSVRSLPLHRIREVYRNSELIWRREG